MTVNTGAVAGLDAFDASPATAATVSALLAAVSRIHNLFNDNSNTSNSDGTSIGFDEIAPALQARIRTEIDALYLGIDNMPDT